MRSFSFWMAIALTLFPAASTFADPPTNPALLFARRDAERMAKALPVFAERTAAAAQAVTAAEKAASDAAAEKVSNDKLLAEFTERLASLESLKAAAEKSAQAAAASAKSAGSSAGASVTKLAQESAELAATVAKLLEERGPARKTAEARKVEIEKKIVDAAAGVKLAIEGKQAAEKLAAEGTAAVKSAADRAAAFEIAVPKADPKQLHLLRTYTHGRQIMSCVIDPAGEYLFGGADDNSVQRWDLFTGSRTEMKGHASWVGSLAWLSTPPTLLSGGYEGKLLWWDPFASAPQPARVTEAHKGFIRAVAVSRDSKYVATCGNDLKVRIWSSTDGAAVAELSGHSSHVYNVAFHPDGRHLISGDLMGVVKQWELETWKHVRDFDAGALQTFDKTFVAHCGGIRGIDFSPDGKFLAVGGIGEVSNAFAGIGKPMVLVFDWADGKRLQVLGPTENFNGSIWGLKYDPTGEYLLGAGGGGGGGYLWIWKPDQPKSLVDFKLPQAARGLQIHPDGLRVIIPLFDGTIRVYDLAPPPAATASKS